MKLFNYNEFIKESSESENENEYIHYLCRKYAIDDYIINEDGCIDVDGNVDLKSYDLTKIPLKFRNVSGYFSCDFNKLTSLENSPILTGGYFSCDSNKLTNLEGSPKEVGRSFYCSENQLTSFEGISNVRGEYIYCFSNNLRDVKGIKDGWRGRLDIIGSPVHEIFKLFSKERWDEVVEYLNEYDVIRDGKVVVLQALEQVYYEMDLDYPEIEYIEGYEII
jgi:hypothetical protein